VFVVGYLGDSRPAAAVLFERESLRGASPPRRETGQSVGATLTRGANSAGRRGEGDVNLAPTLPTRIMGTDVQLDGGLVAVGSGPQSGAPDIATTLSTSTRIDFKTETLTLTVRGREEAPDLEFRGDGIANATLTRGGGRGGMGVGAVAAAAAVRVRRLTPRECERLQGFPDDFTLIPTGENRRLTGRDIGRSGTLWRCR
jgi:DNA (cytosine-5)-methyltransferase 1